MQENAGVGAAEAAGFRGDTWVLPGAGMMGAGGRAPAIPVFAFAESFPEEDEEGEEDVVPVGSSKKKAATQDQPWKNFLGGMAVGLHGRRRELAVSTPDPREGQREASPLASLPAV